GRAGAPPVLAERRPVTGARHRLAAERALGGYPETGEAAGGRGEAQERRRAAELVIARPVLVAQGAGKNGGRRQGHQNQNEKKIGKSELAQDESPVNAAFRNVIIDRSELTCA